MHTHRRTPSLMRMSGVAFDANVFAFPDGAWFTSECVVSSLFSLLSSLSLSLSLSLSSLSLLSLSLISPLSLSVSVIQMIGKH